MIDFDTIEEFDYYNATPEERAAYHEWVIKDQNLDEEEAEFERHFDEFVPCENQEEMRRQLMEAAKRPPVIFHGNETPDTKKPVSLRIGMLDLVHLKEIAKKQGLQYQTLIGSILHRYVNGTLVDVSEVKKLYSAPS